MRFIHTSDVHLGAIPDPGSPWADQRAEELWLTFQQLIETAGRQEIDLLLIAGDLFHHTPLRSEWERVDQLFASIPGTRIVLIAGSHDHIVETSPYLLCPHSPNVTILTSSKMSSVFYPDLNTTVYGFSYHSDEITSARYDHLILPRDGKRHILLGYGGDEKHIPIDFPRLAASGFHYVALGSLHQQALLPKGQIAYSGSPEPVDHEDIGPCGYIMGTMATMESHYQWYPLAKTEYHALTINVDPGTTTQDILSSLQESMSDRPNDLYSVTLEGTRAPGTRISRREVLSLGRIAHLTDNTVPALDLERLQTEHSHDLIAALIEQLDTPDKNPRKLAALNIGLDALLADRRKEVSR